MISRDKIHFVLEPGKSSLKTRYYSEEKSFGLIEPIETISMLLGHQYMSLELDYVSQTIIGVSGFFDISLCKTGTINKRALSLGYVVMGEFKHKVEPGVGYSYPIDGEAIYDPTFNALLVGEEKDVEYFVSIDSTFDLGLNERGIQCIQIRNIY